MAVQYNQMTQALNHSLKSIVSSIATLLNSQDGSRPIKTDAQIPKMNYRTNISYLEFIGKILEGNKKPYVPTSKGESYRIEEDLQLLHELSQYDQEFTLKTFKRISDKGRITRTPESLKGRFQDHLCQIDEQGMLKIVNWIEREGLKGYLYFEDGEVRISHIDPKAEKVQKSKAVPVVAVPVAAGKQKSKQAGLTSVKFSNLPTNCKELNDVLRTYSRMVEVPVKILLEKLDALSGNFELLDEYIESHDERLLWTHDEDEVLRKGGPEAAILLKYRGKSAQARMEYLGLS